MTLVKTGGEGVLYSGNFSLTTTKSDHIFHSVAGLFKKSSGRAFDIQTQLPTHPRDSVEGCVTVHAGKLQDGKSVLLIESSPSEDLIKNWNTGKYDTSYIEGRAVLAGENPDLFNKVSSVTGYTSKPDAIIWLDKMTPADENALAPPENVLLLP